MYIFHQHFSFSEMEFMWFIQLPSSVKAFNISTLTWGDRSDFYDRENPDFVNSGGFEFIRTKDGASKKEQRYIITKSRIVNHFNH